MSTLQYIIFVIILLYFFTVNDSRVEGILGSVGKTSRTQSMRQLTSRRTGQSGSSSSSSSTTSLKTSDVTAAAAAADLQPMIASTSTGRRIDSMSLREVNIQPMMERTRHNSLHYSLDLHDASRATHSIDGNINPARDGVFARVRDAMLHYASVAGVGVIVGASGVELKHKLYPDNCTNDARENINNNNTENTENTENTTLEPIDISIPLF